ncbi:MAG: Fe-Mn family superoxide dismutase [Alphaproteobacteria bacterium]
MFVLPRLPYAYDALEPAISARTLKFHHDKHHKAYVEKSNKLAAEKGLIGKTLEAVIKSASGELFDNSAQAWNHAFYWESMTPDFKKPAAPFAELRDSFIKEGKKHFGSGWVWIMAVGDDLTVVTTHDAGTALKQLGAPLIVCDLWEHAYYLDRQNDRKAYLDAWFDKVANWRFAEKQLRASKGEGEAFAYPAPEDVSAQRKSA